MTLCVRSPSGHRTWLQVNARPISLPGDRRPRAALSTIRDITVEHRARELALRISRQERLLTTGTLAAGVGHEINNLLSYIIGNLELALEEFDHLTTAARPQAIAACRTLLLEAREGAERVRRIVRGLRALAQEGHPAAATDVRHVIAQSLEIAGHVMRGRAAVDLDIDPVPAVIGDEPRLTQVFVNLLMNAAQCFAGDDPARNRVTIRARVDAASVRVEISDNGPGIAPEVLPRIFDPFFTTRPVGQGLGLGLSISYNVVADLGGRLTCHSHPGAGATFTITLPVADPAPVRATGHIKRILLVDDDPAVLASLEFMLEADYQVVAVGNPTEALRLTARTSFDVVIADLDMPHLTGLDLLDAICRHNTSLIGRAVLMSGSAALLDAASEGLSARARRPILLEKPLDAGVVREVIEQLCHSEHAGQTDVGSNGSAAWSRSR
jgi:signal transduction histidine kinase/ActR/RegA family two-component response regulator